MTDEELNAIEARANAATEGPWHWEGDGFGEHAEKCNHGSEWTGHGPDLLAPDGTSDGPVVAGYGYDAWGIDVSAEDAEFIAHARADVPALIAEIRRLRNQS